ncbi:MAG TPA: Omp28-related outer membrane protein [Flavobacteriales bacterium]|nr:Omp28-related outer membrane protein [Flavobacteriales bacterium]
MKYLPLFAATMLFAACDKVENPLGEHEGPSSPPPSGVARRILIEDYTGHRCVFCPEGHQIVEALKEEYGDGLIIISMHVSTLADPEPPGSTMYTTDFRTSDGNAIFERWNTQSIPKALVNRLPYNGTMLPGRSAWSSAVFAQTNLSASVDLWFDTLYLDGSHVRGTAKAAVLSPLSGNHQLVLALTEDSIVDWQLVNGAEPPDQQFYTHRHALRGHLNGTWGEVIINSSASVGDTLTLAFDHPLPSNVLNASRTSLVAYLANSTSDEVIQAVEQKIVE